MQKCRINIALDKREKHVGAPWDVGELDKFKDSVSMLEAEW